MTEETKAEINVSGLHEELQAAGLPVKGVDSNGRITWASNPTGQQVASAAQITAQHKGKPARRDQRAELGITEAAMVEALWEKVFLGTDTKAQILLQKMAALETIE
jgi:hypothetical protein